MPDVYRAPCAYRFLLWRRRRFSRSTRTSRAPARLHALRRHRLRGPRRHREIRRRSGDADERSRVRTRRSACGVGQKRLRDLPTTRATDRRRRARCRRSSRRVPRAKSGGLSESRRARHARPRRRVGTLGQTRTRQATRTSRCHLGARHAACEGIACADGASERTARVAGSRWRSGQREADAQRVARAVHGTSLGRSAAALFGRTRKCARE